MNDQAETDFYLEAFDEGDWYLAIEPMAILEGNRSDSFHSLNR